VLSEREKISFLHGVGYGLRLFMQVEAMDAETAKTVHEIGECFFMKVAKALRLPSGEEGLRTFDEVVEEIAQVLRSAGFLQRPVQDRN
jgi:hypothetical protein